MRSCLPLLFALLFVAGSMSCRADGAEPTEFSLEQLEFFEKEVRPLLAKRCYECHSVKHMKGGLRVDARSTLLAGGDTGPAIEPGKPEDSLLIDAINYGDLYEMPPKGKLPAKEIATLTRWVKMGAPWPQEATTVANSKKFDLAERRDRHWSWKPITNAAPPKVKNKDWPLDDIDRFILAKLEAKGLTPAAGTNRRTLIRRLYFDLIGLPPSPERVAAFVADDDPKALENLVDELLESKHFGERWARHWLDLMRYAESRGHEFDYTTPNAFEYRDYVIRAFNEDLPYDQLVVEHIAGDLLEKPRLRAESDANESILGTGFWFLGEWVHSPVDIRKDETDRFDNMVDVFSKSFLGLTVACARCHDHKFDAISQADYYALFGYLQSSAYRQVRFESLAHNREIARQAEQLRSSMGPALLKEIAQGVRTSPSIPHIAAGLRVLNEAKPSPEQDIVLFDFESGDFAGWESNGDAFAGGVPQDQKSIAKYQGNVKAKGTFFVNSHNHRTSLDQEESQHSDKFTGELLSPEFVLNRTHITMLVGGGAHQGRTCVNLLVDGKAVMSATGRNSNVMSPVNWDVSAWTGKTARLQVVDRHHGGWGNISLDHVVLTNAGGATLPSSAVPLAAQLAKEGNLSRDQVLAWAEELHAAKREPSHPFHVIATSNSLKRDTNRHTTDDVEGEVLADYSKTGHSPFLQDGVTFGAGPIGAGQAWFDGKTIKLTEYGAARRSALFRELRLAGGVQKDAGRLGKWDRAGKTLRTKTFVLKPQRVFALVRGKGLSYGVVDSHRMINGPLHGSLVREFDTKGELQWIEHNLARYAGHNAHMEYVPLGKEEFEVVRVVQTANRPQLAASSWDGEDQQLVSIRQSETIAIALIQFVGAVDSSAERFITGQATRRDLERMAVYVARPRLLNDAAFASIRDKKQELIRRLIDLNNQVRNESRTAPAMWDGTPFNDVLLIRGNSRTPGKEVPRRMLTALGGQPSQQPTGSGRLDLARQLMAPTNPYPARVMVNRIWGHLTGRPIVPSPDNFGVLGREPSHPDLLDHLAQRFITNDYSVKRMIRSIVLSRTYQMASTPSVNGTRQDPNNELLHRMRIRRLEGEAIRDSLLTVAGRLNEKQHGPPVPVYLTAFMQGRGRPGSGPLDGAGRRSIYISVRRNFLSPMMLAFDVPQPFSSVGRRTVSNVPAQALILLNDPLVLEMAKQWAKKLVAETNGLEQRIEQVYEQALSRPPTAEEKTAAIAFLSQQGKFHGLTLSAGQDDERLWTDLCHVIFNVKEFIYIR